MIASIIIILFSICATPLHAQPDIAWEGIYDKGENNYNRFRDVYRVSEDGYIACGCASCLWLCRIDRKEKRSGQTVMVVQKHMM